MNRQSMRRGLFRSLRLDRKLRIILKSKGCGSYPGIRRFSKQKMSSVPGKKLLRINSEQILSLTTLFTLRRPSTAGSRYASASSPTSRPTSTSFWYARYKLSNFTSYLKVLPHPLVCFALNLQPRHRFLQHQIVQFCFLPREVRQVNNHSLARKA